MANIVGQRQGKITLANGKGKLWSNGKGKTCHDAARKLPSRQMANINGKVCRGKGQRTPVKWQRKTVSVYGKGKGFVTPRQRNSGQMARAKESSGLRQGKLFRRIQGKFFRSRHGKVCFRSVRSSGHTACDGKACCRSLCIPTDGAGATAASQSQHELMTSLVVRHYVSQWQRCIVRTIVT